MQSSTGQYSTQAGDPAHPVQHSVITANSFGFFFRGVARPLDFGSNLSSSGTIPTALVAPGAAGMEGIITRLRARPEAHSAMLFDGQTGRGEMHLGNERRRIQMQRSLTHGAVTGFLLYWASSRHTRGPECLHASKEHRHGRKEHQQSHSH